MKHRCMQRRFKRCQDSQQTRHTSVMVKYSTGTGTGIANDPVSWRGNVDGVCADADQVTVQTLFGNGTCARATP